jgi:hypothetical protein
MSVAAPLFRLQPDGSSYSRGMVVLLVFYCLLGISPVWHAIGLTQMHLMAGTVFALLVLSYMHRRELAAWVVLGSLVLFTCTFAAGIYWAEPRLTLYPMFLILSLVLLTQSTKRELVRFIDIASWLVLVLLIGALVGFVLARLGATPLFSIPNVDTRPNYFFYTTFSNAYYFRWIQPSGIYDEPGAFSFMICAVAFLRHITGRDYRLTWIMLGLGFVTLSLAHLIFVAVFALAERISIRRIAFLGLAVAALAGTAYATGLTETYRQYLFARLTFDAANQRGFDSRIQLARNAGEALATVERATLFGVDSDCTVNYLACRQKWDYLGENPLAPLAHHGLLLAWPYYLFLALALLFPLAGRRHLAFLALALLFLQRPYVVSFGYSFLAVAGLWLQLETMGRGAWVRQVGPRGTTMPLVSVQGER